MKISDELLFQPADAFGDDELAMGPVVEGVIGASDD
jgi:hypothetical protein